MRTIAGMLVLLLAWGAAAARAEETRKMEPVVVTATTVETPAEQLGATVSVITEEDFRTYHYVTVQDALRSGRLFVRRVAYRERRPLPQRRLRQQGRQRADRPRPAGRQRPRLHPALQPRRDAAAGPLGRRQRRAALAAPHPALHRRQRAP